MKQDTQMMQKSTVNIPPLSNIDVEFDIPEVQVPVPSSDEDHYAIDNQEMQPDLDTHGHDLPATSMVIYSCDVNCPSQ